MLITFIILKVCVALFGLQCKGYVIGTRVRLPKYKFQLTMEKPSAQKITKNPVLVRKN